MNSRIIRKAIAKKRAQKLEEEIEYIRFSKDYDRFLRGTVILPSGDTIPGYPHIPRIFTLDEGVGKNIDGSHIFIEEKIDGFNLRVASVEGKIFAFSRGGYLDAFATEKIRNQRIMKFFRHYPNHMLCGEMIGNTPHTPPTGNYDVRFLVFDIMQTENFLPCKEKYDILKEHTIESVPLLGRFKKSGSESNLRRIAFSLNQAGKEGMVIKASDRKSLVKYVTPNSDIEDIGEGAATYPDMPAGFFYQRVLRSALFIRDFSLDQEEYANKLGSSFYKNLIHAIHKAENEGVSREYEILIKDQKIWGRMKKHMGKGVKIEELYRREEKNGTRIRFLKRYRKSDRRLKAYLDGKSETD